MSGLKEASNNLIDDLESRQLLDSSSKSILGNKIKLLLQNIRVWHFIKLILNTMIITREDFLQEPKAMSASKSDLQ